MLRFGVITDCQYAEIDETDPNRDRHFRMSPKKLEEVVEFFNDQQLDFVVYLGDFIDRDSGNFAKLNSVTAELKHPLFHVLGNHDFLAGDRHNPGRNTMQEVLDALSMESPYYSRQFGDFRLLFLDTNEVGVIEHPPGSPEHTEGQKLLDRLLKQGKEYAEDWNGTLSEEQFDWMLDEIDQAEDAGQKVIILAHHPAYPDVYNNLLEPEKMRAILKDRKSIVAYLSGHHHEGLYGVYEDVPCLTFKAMLDTKENSYSVVEIDQSTLTVTGYGREDSRKVTLR